jgi:hypothetical protein
VLSVMFASAGNLDNASASALFTPGLYSISKSWTTLPSSSSRILSVKVGSD